jgi:hypothetical protein
MSGKSNIAPDALTRHHELDLGLHPTSTAQLNHIFVASTELDKQ